MKHTTDFTPDISYLFLLEANYAEELEKRYSVLVNNLKTRLEAFAQSSEGQGFKVTSNETTSLDGEKLTLIRITPPKNDGNAVSYTYHGTSITVKASGTCSLHTEGQSYGSERRSQSGHTIIDWAQDDRTNAYPMIMATLRRIAPVAFTEALTCFDNQHKLETK